MAPQRGRRAPLSRDAVSPARRSTSWPARSRTGWLAGASAAFRSPKIRTAALGVARAARPPMPWASIHPISAPASLVESGNSCRERFAFPPTRSWRAGDHTYRAIDDRQRSARVVFAEKLGRRHFRPKAGVYPRRDCRSALAKPPIASAGHHACRSFRPLLRGGHPLDALLGQPLPRRRAQALRAEREPALALGQKVEQHVLESPESAAAVQGDLQPIPQPRIAHRPGELFHPAVLDARAERLDMDQVSRRQYGVDLVLREPAVVIVQAVHGNHLDLAEIG